MIKNILFPNLEEPLGFYDPTYFNITLNSVDRNGFGDILKNGFDDNNIEHFKTYWHELRHNIDHYSTLWGQRNLLSYHEAINSILANDAFKFDKVITYKHNQKKNFYDEYYTVTYNQIPLDQFNHPWAFETSIGLRFDHKGLPDPTKPILLLQFYTRDNEIPLFRIPLSVASLLETNAKASEMAIHLSYLMNPSKRDDLNFNVKMYGKGIKNNLVYNQNLAVYNSAVHTIANFMELSDIFEVYRISQYISTLALNLPRKIVELIYFDKDEFKNVIDRVEWLIKNNEYGFIFYLLVKNYRETYKIDKAFSLDKLLESSKLPSYKEVEFLILEEIKDIQNSMSSLPSYKNMFLEKSMAGENAIKKLGIALEKLSTEPEISNLNFKFNIYYKSESPEIDFVPFGHLQLQQSTDFTNIKNWHTHACAFEERFDTIYNIRGL